MGDHDENIDFDAVTARLGAERAAELRDITLRLYREAAAYALPRGLIIADTKFEFGVDAQGRLHLIDEALTPDSSRFWDAESYAPGRSPPASTSRSSVIISKPWTGTKRRRGRSCRMKSSCAPAPVTAKPKPV